jgi:hypothetical protein
VVDTHGDLGNLTLSAVAAADSVLTVFTSDPGSALGAARVAAFLEQHRRFENTTAVLVGVACALWDKQGRAAREVVGALEGTGLPLLPTRIPLSRRVPSATLAKRPVVLSRTGQRRGAGVRLARRRGARLVRPTRPRSRLVNDLLRRPVRRACRRRAEAHAAAGARAVPPCRCLHPAALARPVGRLRRRGAGRRRRGGPWQARVPALVHDLRARRLTVRA